MPASKGSVAFVSLSKGGVASVSLSEGGVALCLQVKGVCPLHLCKGGMPSVSL